MEKITLGAGCFWCVEEIYRRIEGVEKAVSGYMGGDSTRASYEDVCTGTTGHAEVVQLTFDPSKVSVDKILRVFFEAHDPTTLNRQGADVGTQYRSAIFYHSAAQARQSREIISELDRSRLWDNKIVTEVTAASEFFTAENFHQNYYEANGEQPYCRLVIKPKVEKMEKAFERILKAS